MLKKCFFVLFFLIPNICFSQEKIKWTAEKIENAMLFIVNGNLPKKFKIGQHKKNQIRKNEKYRKDLALAIKEASEKHFVDGKLSPMHLVVIAFREGSFKKVIISESSIGERSTFQIAPRTERWLRKNIEPSCNTKTYKAAALCSAALLRLHFIECGKNVRGALNKYATGKRCKSESDRVKWVIEDRLEIVNHLLKIEQN
jgi:hypothetical protein